MKKLLCIILALAAFWIFTSCNSINDYVESTSKNSDTESELKIESDTKKETEKKPAESSNDKESAPKPSFLTVNGVDISEYKIVYSSDFELCAKEQAERLAAHVKNSFDVSINIVTDPESTVEKAIFITNTLPEALLEHTHSPIMRLIMLGICLVS